MVVWYGVIDEWLQGYVGRNPDVRDFLADLAGTFTGLILLSIFPFWPLSLAITGSAVFILSNFMQEGITDQIPGIDVLFHLFAYSLFSAVWLRYMSELLPVRAPQASWVIGSLVLPTGLLLTVKLFSVAAGNGIGLTGLLASLAGIITVIGTVFLKASFRRNHSFVQ
jgi:hypothetical protein